MIISGTYLERLVLVILPITIPITLLLYFSTGEFNNLLIGIILAFLIWLLDTIIIYKKYKPKKVKFEKVLLINDEKINLENIKSITPISDERMRWSFKLVVITLSDNRIFHFIEKPQFFINDIMDKPSKSIQIIIDYVPEIKDRIHERKHV
jgi:hypothetical protein